MDFSIYDIVLFLHSWMRWIVLIALVLAVPKYLASALSAQGWTGTDKTLKTVAVASADTQLLLGLVLYFVSPITQTAMESMKEAMKIAPVRFFAVEHPALMLLAIVMIHVGSVVIKRSKSDKQRHLRGVFYFGLALVFVLIATPWPSLSYGRALFRL